MIQYSLIHNAFVILLILFSYSSTPLLIKPHNTTRKVLLAPFIDHETETQKDEVTYSNHRARKYHSWNLSQKKVAPSGIGIFRVRLALESSGGPIK